MGIENRFLLRTGSQCFNSLESFANFSNDSLINSSGRERRHHTRCVAYASHAMCVASPVQPAVNSKHGAQAVYNSSKVWLHFTKKDDNRATCNTCKVDISSKGGNTTNMQKHLRSQHAISINECCVFDPLRTNVSESQPSSSSKISMSSANTADN